MLAYLWLAYPVFHHLWTSQPRKRKGEMQREVHCIENRCSERCELDSNETLGNRQSIHAYVRRLFHLPHGEPERWKMTMDPGSILL